MKRVALLLAVVAVSMSSFAQKEDEEKSHKFRRDNIFLGGTIGLGLSNGTFGVGANPEVGYSVAQWIDAGISTNLNYTSITAEYNQGIRQRSFNYGGGMFIRLYPLRNFFVQVLPEYNWIRYSLKDIAFNGTGEELKFTREAPSLLFGAGYTTREIGSTSFFTVIMFDAGNNPNSPYVGYLGSKFPILRTGVNIYLNPKRK